MHCSRHFERRWRPERSCRSFRNLAQCAAGNGRAHRHPINNAGVFEANPIDASDIEWLDGWERTMAINLTASAQLAARHPSLKSAGPGGAHYKRRQPRRHRGDSLAHWHYAASKGGMVAMTRHCARLCRAANLRIRCLPRIHDDRNGRGIIWKSRGGDKLLADILLGRVAMPEEVATLIRFCALEAPPSMTGAAVLDINGASYVR